MSKSFSATSRSSLVSRAMRVVGRVVSMGGDPLTEENMLEIFNEVCDDFAKKKFADRAFIKPQLRSLGP